jgi:hypothetical protein
VVPRMALSNGIDHAAIEMKRAEWPSIPLDPALVRRAQLRYAERVVERERRRQEAEAERRRVEAEQQVEEERRRAERVLAHAAELQYLKRIELVAQSDEALVEALRPTIGEIAAGALVYRLRKIQAEIDSLAARLRYV